MLKKKKKFTLRRDCPTHLPTHTKIKWSVPKSIQKKIVEYDIKSKYPEEYSTVDKVGGEKPLASKPVKVGGEKPLASKSCFV